MKKLLWIPMLGLLALPACNEGVKKARNNNETVTFEDQAVSEETHISNPKFFPVSPPNSAPPPEPQVQEISKVQPSFNTESYAHLPAMATTRILITFRRLARCWSANLRGPCTPSRRM